MQTDQLQRSPREILFSSSGAGKKTLFSFGLPISNPRLDALYRTPSSAAES